MVGSAPEVQTGTSVEPGMWVKLSPAQRRERERFAAFVDRHIAPRAAEWDRTGALPMEIRDLLRDRGYLGVAIAAESGGGGMDPLLYGLLTEEIGRACSSTRSLLTVHDMTAYTVWRWGRSRLDPELVRQLVSGDKLAAIALSEPNVGSDAAAVETTARLDGDSFVLSGRKKWVTFGQVADYFMILARCAGKKDGEPVDGKLVALLVAGDTPGLERQPMNQLLGTRAARVAELCLHECKVPAEQLLGKIGFGLSHVAATALDHGRFSVAWGAVGIARACVEASVKYADERVQFGKPIAEHQLVRRKLTEMITATHAARLLCCRAATLRRDGDPAATGETLMAKYVASRTAVAAANAAVQLHGGNGLSEDYPVERYLRDAKVTEIIEGSSQIQQILIPRLPLPEL
ncbi:MAG: acyl-CoA dehydrogenase family protein [Thermoanaerobaculia bacterium]